MAAIAFPLLTSRLALRPFVLEDAPAMRAVYEDEAVMRYVGTGRFRDATMTAALLREYAEQQAKRGFAFWAVVEQASGRLIGDAGLTGLPAPEPALELGYTLRRDCWGRGLATEAARACVRVGFEVLGVPAVVALVEPANVASVRVVEKVGMERTGEQMMHGRKHHVFRLDR
ncbi:MAG: GNAT family N-acetyltransferase [Actinomycetota bacterium]|nr:GNAT family N-acetyltransferase [Actinomycetota bacterium]